MTDSPSGPAATPGHSSPADAGSPVPDQQEGPIRAKGISSSESPTPDRVPTGEGLRALVEQILDGIDRQETDVPAGWWETSNGAEFGAEILQKIRAVLTSSPDPTPGEPT